MYSVLSVDGKTVPSVNVILKDYSTLGGPTVFEDLTDSPENQHVFLSLLQNLKSKISEKSGQN